MLISLLAVVGLQTRNGLRQTEQRRPLGSRFQSGLQNGDIVFVEVMFWGATHFDKILCEDDRITLPRNPAITRTNKAATRLGRRFSLRLSAQRTGSSACAGYPFTSEFPITSR